MLASKLEICDNAAMWSGNQIGLIEDNIAQLDFSMENLVNSEFKFVEVQDIITHFNEIVETLTKQNYQVEIENAPQNNNA